MAQELSDLLINIGISTFMVLLTTSIYYEILRLCWNLLPKIKTAPRRRLIVVVIAIFTGHTIAVWAYAVAYWLMAEYMNLGMLVGEFDSGFISYLYYSAATYSSLGIGDIFPQGHLRFLTGVEVLNGLVMIGWSVSFTYLAMEKFWDMHPRRAKKR